MEVVQFKIHEILEAAGIANQFVKREFVSLSAFVNSVEYTKSTSNSQYSSEVFHKIQKAAITLFPSSRTKQRFLIALGCYFITCKDSDEVIEELTTGKLSVNNLVDKYFSHLTDKSDSLADENDPLADNITSIVGKNDDKGNPLVLEVKQFISNKISTEVRNKISTEFRRYADRQDKQLTEKLNNLVSNVAQEIEEAKKQINFLRPLEITVPWSSESVEISGTTHSKFEKVLRKVKAGMPILLTGPTGSGKTFLAAQVAKALQLPFTFNSMSEGITESSLLGRMLPNEEGKFVYQPSPFVESYSNGGVHLLDEIDAGDPNLLVQINAAISNRKLSIPYRDCEPISRHPRSIIIAAANTFGRGANRDYVGRNPLDGATLDRFTMGTIEVGYDRSLEFKLVDLHLSSAEDDPGISANDLVEKFWKIREAIESNHLRRFCSTRNIINAAKCVASGESFEEVLEDYFLGWTEDERDYCK